MIRTLRLLLLLLLVAMVGLAWPADAAAQRGPSHSGRGGVAVARPAGGPHGGGYGYHAPYYPARYYPPAYYSYPRYYAPYSWAVGFGFGGRLVRIVRHLWIPLRIRLSVPVSPSHTPTPTRPPTAMAIHRMAATVVHVVPRNGPASSQDRSPYDGPGTSAKRLGRRDQSDFATLSLRISPADAEILIDGEPWDRANGDNRFTIDVAAGRHQLEIRREGYGALRQDDRPAWRPDGHPERRPDAEGTGPAPAPADIRFPRQCRCASRGADRAVESGRYRNPSSSAASIAYMNRHRARWLNGSSITRMPRS